MEFAIRETLLWLGIEIVDLPDASCCPDPIFFKSKDKLSWLAVAARNLTLAQDLGLDVFTNCSGCTATLADAYHLLKPSRIMRVDDPNNPTVMAHLIDALGAAHVRHRNWYLCCGKACQTEEIPANMMRDLLATVNED